MPVTGSVLDAWRVPSADDVQVLAAVREAVNTLHANPSWSRCTAFTASQSRLQLPALTGGKRLETAHW